MQFPTQKPPMMPLEAGPQPRSPFLPAENEPSTTEELLEASKKKLGELNSTQLMGEQRIQAAKTDGLRSLLMALADAGVDLADEGSIAAFRQKLYESNPDLLQMFDDAMASLLPDEEPEDVMMGQDGDMEDMNIE